MTLISWAGVKGYNTTDIMIRIVIRKYGHEFYYSKSSLGGSLINVLAGYTQLNTGSSYGNEWEEAYYLRLDRPLVSPYSRFAGAWN
jgi:hypothetical protein